GDGAGDDLALLAAGRGHQHHARPGRDQGGEQRAGGERFVVGVRVDGEDGRGVLEQLPRRGDRHGGVAGEGGVGGHEAAPGAVWRAVTVVYRLARASAALSQVRV